MNTYVEIASSTPLLEELRNELELGNDRPNSIDVSVIPETELLQIRVEDVNPVLARDAANTLAALLVDDKPIRDIRIYVVEPAGLPGSTSVLRNLIYSVLGLVVGLIGGIGLAFLVENLDPRLHSSEQIQAVTGLPLLGEIPTAKRRDSTKLLLDKIPYSDVFRRIRVKILSLSKDAALQTILITSAEPDEGKSTVLANLACSLAQSGQRIVVVDADMYCPTINTFFDLPNEPGLSNVLEQDITLTDVLQKTHYSGIEVLTSGTQNSNSAELLGTEQMVALLDQLKKQFDFVLVDTPAFLGIVDTIVLAPYMDGVVVVARSGSVKETELQITCQQSDSVNAKLIGIIVNRSQSAVPHKYYKYYHRAANS
jgi:capsular exopolysaccharide synthesis family protein